MFETASDLFEVYEIGEETLPLLKNRSYISFESEAHKKIKQYRKICIVFLLKNLLISISLILFKIHSFFLFQNFLK